MSYLQITTKCNMSCRHCCYACGPKGKHMSQKVWDAALKMISDEEGPEASISIGGGEPTLHPQFWNYLIDAISTFDYVWLATNGSQTATALKLAKLAAKGVIGCALSQDEYHDPIDPEVVEAFWEGQRKNDARRYSYGNTEKYDGREIRTVTRDPSHLSPFRDPEDGGESDNCPCDTIIIKPDGKIRFCGCRNAPLIGNVFDGWKKPEGADEYECWSHYQRDLKAKKVA